MQTDAKHELSPRDTGTQECADAQERAGAASMREPEWRESMVLYRSQVEAILRAPDEATQNQLLRDLVFVFFGLEALDDLPYPNDVYVKQALFSSEYSYKRYTEAVENGKKGGRPKLEIDVERANRLYGTLGSWDLVAKAMDTSPSTLYRARRDAAGGASKGQNLNEPVPETKTKTKTSPLPSAKPGGTAGDGALRKTGARQKTQTERDADDFEQKRRAAIRVLQKYGMAQNAPL